MRISDWSSDVCSSDLFLAVAAIAGDDNAGPCKAGEDFGNADCSFGQFTADRFGEHPDAGLAGGIRRHVGHNPDGVDRTDEIGRAAGRARVCEYGSIWGVAV